MTADTLTRAGYVFFGAALMTMQAALLAVAIWGFLPWTVRPIATTLGYLATYGMLGCCGAALACLALGAIRRA